LVELLVAAMANRTNELKYKNQRMINAHLLLDYYLLSNLMIWIFKKLKVLNEAAP